MDGYIVDEILKRLGESEENNVQALSYGQPKSFEQYTELVGRISGIRACMQDVLDIKEMLERQEQDDT